MDFILECICIMNIEQLLKALDNDKNEDIIDSTRITIKNKLKDALDELELDNKTYNEFLSKLTSYRHIDNISLIRPGSYIRWIKLGTDTPKLTAGCHICDINFTDNGIIITCKNFRNSHFNVYFDQCVIFQRLSDQEEVLLSAIDYLSK